MIETFHNKKEASTKANKRYNSSIPNLYIVGFKDGIIFDQSVRIKGNFDRNEIQWLYIKSMIYNFIIGKIVYT